MYYCVSIFDCLLFFFLSSDGNQFQNLMDLGAIERELGIIGKELGVFGT
jgi:hypothetical protein